MYIVHDLTHNYKLKSHNAPKEKKRKNKQSNKEETI